MGAIGASAEDIMHALGILGSNDGTFNPDGDGIKAYTEYMRCRLFERADLRRIELDAEELYANSRNAAAFMKQTLATKLLTSAVKVAGSDDDVAHGLHAAIFAIGGKQAVAHFHGMVNDVKNGAMTLLPMHLSATLNAIDDAGYIEAAIQSQLDDKVAANPAWQKFVRQRPQGDGPSLPGTR